MSSFWAIWFLVSILTGNPLGALLVVLAVTFLLDRFTWRVVPSPARALARVRRAGALRRTLAVNPHDRRARLELADLLLARRPGEAARLARENVEAGDEDAATLYVFGAGLARSGDGDSAEKVLAAARAAEPGFRLGEIDLELARLRLQRRDFAGARDAAARLVAERPGTVEGRWLLARALGGLGDAAGAARVREDGWREYLALPGFRRREERPYAYRLRPARGALAIAGLAVGVLAAIVCVVGLVTALF